MNARYPIDRLIDAAAEYQEKKGRRVSLEWTLMAGVNDTVDQARALASIARELHAHVNVIALNPTPLALQQRPSRAAVDRFMTWLEEFGAAATLRDTRGEDIDAACGQLRVRSET